MGAVSGTQGIAGSADFILVLRRKRQSNDAVLSVTGRDVPENEYALTTEGGLWLLDGADLTAAAEAVKTRKNTENLGDRSVDVLAYVTRNPEGVTPAQTDAALGITDSKVYLARLYKKGSLDRPVRGIYTTVTSPSACYFCSECYQHPWRECRSNRSNGSNTARESNSAALGRVVNRRQRRTAARTAGGRAALTYADQYTCPDCASETELRRDDDGVFLLEVRHDDTCPTFRRIRGGA